MTYYFFDADCFIIQLLILMFVSVILSPFVLIMRTKVGFGKFSKIPNQRSYLEQILSLKHWFQIEKSFQKYEAGEIEQETFLAFALRTLGKNFIKIFKDGTTMLGQLILLS